MARRSVHGQQDDQEHSTGRHTKCDHIEDFDRFVGSRCRKTASIGTDIRTADFTRVGAEFLHELDTFGHLLPELDNSVDRAGDNKVGDRSDGHE